MYKVRTNIYGERKRIEKENTEEYFQEKYKEYKKGKKIKVTKFCNKKPTKIKVGIIDASNNCFITVRYKNYKESYLNKDPEYSMELVGE